MASTLHQQSVSCVGSADLAIGHADTDAVLSASLSGRFAAVLVELTDAQSHASRALHLEAQRFFKQNARKHCGFATSLPNVGPSVVMQGYRGCAVKELIRLFAGCRAPPDLPAALRRSAARMARELDSLLTRCLRCIIRSKNAGVSERALRRLIKKNKCLDLFNYFNSVGSQLPNCEAHVDRGFLHAIVASPVDGLELQSNADGTWHAPHALWPQITPHAHAVVFVNDALAQLSESWSPAAGARADEPRSRHDEPLVACTHRVVRSKAGPVPRLSISYELRPAADAEPEAWSAVRGSALLTPPYR